MKKKELELLETNQKSRTYTVQNIPKKLEMKKEFLESSVLLVVMRRPNMGTEEKE
jgi:hypothetical protein